MSDRPKSAAMEPSLSTRMHRDTERCECDPESERAERPTIPPTLAQLAEDAERQRTIHETAQHAVGLLGGPLTEILSVLRSVEIKVDRLEADRMRLADIEARLAKLEGCCVGCPRAVEREIGAVDGHG